MIIGIGGAGSKITSKLQEENSCIINVSKSELDKIEVKKKILAFVHTENGLLDGAKKNQEIGKIAFQTIKKDLLKISKGSLIISSTGGGSGSGIVSSLLDELNNNENILDSEKIRFLFILPYANLEAQEYIDNTIKLLEDKLFPNIENGNIGNVYLFSNNFKFIKKISEIQYNHMITEAMKKFNEIPQKGERLELLEGHIDKEDFQAFQTKSFFNYFTYFYYDPTIDFKVQLEKNKNPFLLNPSTPIEALFLLEIPENIEVTIFYNILLYFSELGVNPTYSVVRNPELQKPFITVSLLYSSKPQTLIENFKETSDQLIKNKVNKVLNQDKEYQKLNTKLETDNFKKYDGDENEVLKVLKRIGKI